MQRFGNKKAIVRKHEKAVQNGDKSGDLPTQKNNVKAFEERGYALE